MDFVEQTTTTLVHSFDLIAGRGANVAAKTGLNRAISAQRWSMLRRRLSDNAAT